MTPIIPPIYQWFFEHPNAAPWLGLFYTVIMIVGTVFACVQLWLIRAATEQTKDETLHSRLILSDLLKAAETLAAAKRKTENTPSADSPRQDRRSASANPKSVPSADDNYLPPS